MITFYALTTLGLLAFAVGVADTIRRVNQGDTHDTTAWPEDLRDLPRPEPARRDYSGDRAPIPAPRLRASIYEQLAAQLGFDPLGAV